MLVMAFASPNGRRLLLEDSGEGGAGSARESSGKLRKKRKGKKRNQGDLRGVPCLGKPHM